MNKTCVLCFSFNRPLQLDLVLASFYYHCDDYLHNMKEAMEEIRIKVLYRTNNEKFKDAYETLKSEYEDVEFIEEGNFKQDLLNSINGFNRILFMTDDNIWVKSFCLEEVNDLLDLQDNVLGFSFRLGDNTEYCYSLNKEQKLPKIYDVFSYGNQIILKYNWTIADADFSYSLELSSSMYRIKDIFNILKYADYNSPNSLEWEMYCNLRSFTKDKPYLFYYEKSVAFCAPMNKVQNVNNNRAGKDDIYSVDNLLKFFEEGFRVDVRQFDGFVPNSCHCEYDFLGGLVDGKK
jgi:hypothetical protein